MNKQNPGTDSNPKTVEQKANRIKLDPKAVKMLNKIWKKSASLTFIDDPVKLQRNINTAIKSEVRELQELTTLRKKGFPKERLLRKHNDQVLMLYINERLKDVEASLRFIRQFGITKYFQVTDPRE